MNNVDNGEKILKKAKNMPNSRVSNWFMLSSGNQQWLLGLKEPIDKRKCSILSDSKKKRLLEQKRDYYYILNP